MKKIGSIAVFSLTLLFFSCGTTSNTAQLPQTEEPSLPAEITPADTQNPETEITPSATETTKEEEKPLAQQELEPKTDEDYSTPEGVIAEKIDENSSENSEETSFEVVNVEDANPDELPQDQLVLETAKKENESAETADPIKEIAEAVAKLEEKVDGLIADKDNSQTAAAAEANVTNAETTENVEKNIESEATSYSNLPHSPAKETVSKSEPAVKAEAVTKDEPSVKPETVTKTETPVTEPTPDSPVAEKPSVATSTSNSETSETDLFEAPVVINPSRSVTVKKNQFLDVTYPGNGWIYIGETQKDPLLTYFGRKLAKGNTTFSLKSKKNGQTVLHFYKNDPLTGNYIDDYLDVTVENEIAKSNTRTQAPSYAEIVPPKPEKRGVTFFEPETEVASTPAEKEEAPEIQTPAKTSSVAKAEVPVKNTQQQSKIEKDDANIKTVVEKTSPSERTSTNITSIDDKTSTKAIVLPAGNLLEEAKKALADKKYESALSYIQVYLDSESTKIDEALYVQGQILEAESSVKNVRSAIDSYNTVVKKYPASRWWKQSNERSIYLKRFYIDIR